MDESPFALRAATLLFAVDLDGRTIGTHEFHVEPRADDTVEVRSVASFGVRLLGIPVYRYRHEANETWTDGCLRALSASTNDDGRQTRVVAEPAVNGSRLRIATNGVAVDADGCVRGFAYWRPQWLSAPMLLNPQTGHLDATQLSERGDEPLALQDGRTVQARHLRLRAGELDIDLWYGGDGEWLQLTSVTPDGRHLRYRRAVDRR